MTRYGGHVETVPVRQRMGSQESDGSQLNIKAASYRANVSIETVRRWCVRHGIGRKSRLTGQWTVDPDGLAYIIAGYAAVLREWKRNRERVAA